VALELAQDAKTPMPLAGLVDQLVSTSIRAHEGAAVLSRALQPCGHGFEGRPQPSATLRRAPHHRGLRLLRGTTTHRASSLSARSASSRRMRPARKDWRMQMPTDAFIRVARAGGHRHLTAPVESRQLSGQRRPTRHVQGRRGGSGQYFLAIWMAQAAGFDEAQGLKLEIVPMVGRERIPARAQGRPHPSHCTSACPPWVRANPSGRGDLRSIGSLANIIRSTMFHRSEREDRGGPQGAEIIGLSAAWARKATRRPRWRCVRLGLTRQDFTVQEIGVDRLPPSARERSRRRCSASPPQRGIRGGIEPDF